MASNVSNIEALTDAPIAVDPRAIEDEFARIWRETAGAGLDESSIRLRVFNFIGIADSSDAAQRFERVMEVLPEHHPCRGILAMTSPGLTAVTAEISAHCWRAGAGSRHVCSEEVLLRSGPGEEQALASAVLALLVTELPVTAWLIGDVGLDDAIATALVDAADCVFIDSAGAPDPHAAMRAAARARRTHDTEISDLAWCRLKSWRGLVAQFFDSAEGAQQLSTLQSIEIQSSGAQPSGEALLLAGWLVSRLKLTLASLDATPSAIEGTLYDGADGVQLSVSSSGDASLPLRLVRLRTKDASFLIERHEESGHLHVREDWPDTNVRRSVDQPPSDDASVLAEALDDDDDPKVFFAALRAALLLLGDEPTGSPGSPS